jgi:hypothetical protein
MRAHSIPATHDGKVWTTLYVCNRCGDGFLHAEVSPADDDPHGLPFSMRWCCCGGFLFARPSDYASTHG